MTRKEKIIEIFKTYETDFDTTGIYTNTGITSKDFDKIADAILALPINVPSEEEIKESSQHYIEKHTIDRPVQWTYIDGYEDAISEIIKRNQK